MYIDVGLNYHIGFFVLVSCTKLMMKMKDFLPHLFYPNITAYTCTVKIIFCLTESCDERKVIITICTNATLLIVERDYFRDSFIFALQDIDKHIPFPHYCFCLSDVSVCVCIHVCEVICLICTLV